MSVSISGVLLDPFGEPASFAEVKFITWQGANDVLTTAPAVFKTSADGAYSFAVEFSTYTVQVRYNQSNGKFQTIKQKVIVNSDVTATTLGELLQFNEPLTPPEIAYVEQLVAEAEGYRDETEQFANDAEQSALDSANSAASSAQSAQEAADSAALLAPVILGDGIWGTDKTYTAYNQYLIYDGQYYSPLPTTALPYPVVTTTPDLALVYPINLNSLQALSGLNDPSDLDKSYRRAATVSQIENGNFPVGSRLTVTDRGDAPFNVVSGGTPNGSDILDAGNGNTAAIVIDGWMTPEMFGAKGDNITLDTPSLISWAANSDFLTAKAGAVYIHDGAPIIHRAGAIFFLGASEFKLQAGNYTSNIKFFRNKDIVNYNPLEPREKGARFFDGVINGNIANVTTTDASTNAIYQFMVDGAEVNGTVVKDLAGDNADYPAVQYFYSNNCDTTNLACSNTDRQNLQYWESTGNVRGGTLTLSRQRDNILISSMSPPLYQGSDVQVTGVKMNNVGSTNGDNCVRFSGKSSGKITKCHMYSDNSNAGDRDLRGVYVTDVYEHNVTVEDNDIYNANYGLYVTSDGADKTVISKNNRYRNCYRPIYAIYSGADASFESTGDKFLDSIERPFTVDFVPNVTFSKAFIRGGSSNAFIGNYTSLNFDGGVFNTMTSAGQCLNLGGRNGDALANINGVSMKGNTSDNVSTIANILSRDNECTFSGAGLALGKVGQAFLWSTPTGVAYINTSEPSSYTDGTIIGTQT